MLDAAGAPIAGYADGAGVFARAWRAGLAPDPDIGIAEWAAKNRVLTSEGGSAEPGPYRVDRTPYVGEILEALSPTSEVQDVSLMFAAQTAKTTTIDNWLGHSIDCAPGPIMIVQPTLAMAKIYARQRVSQMIESTPALRARVAKARTRDASNTTLRKEFKGGSLVVSGANSGAGLRMMSVRYLAMDEIDAYPDDVDGEGDPEKLAEARTNTYRATRKILRTSTPTTKGFSRIEARFLAGDRRRYHVPCPHCGMLFVMRWQNIRWDEGKPETAYLVCAEPGGCGGVIREHQKTWMMDPANGARWIAERPEEARRMSCHLPALYSPLGWYSWAEAATEFVAAKRALDAGDATRMKTWTNLVLAETWEEPGNSLTGNVLADRARREEHKLREVPHGALVLVGSADVQGDRIEVLVQAFGRGEESWIVDYVVISGDPSAMLDGSDARLDQVIGGAYRNASSGRDMRIAAFAIDSGGHHTHEVYAFARKRAHRHVLAVKGASTAGRPVLGRPTDVDINFRGEKIKRGAKLWLVGSDTAKSLIYGRMNVERSGPGCMHFAADLPDEFFAGATSERLVTRYHKGRPRAEWVLQKGMRNEPLDLLCYAYAAACYVGIPRYREHDWARLEAATQPARDRDAEPDPTDKDDTGDRSGNEDALVDPNQPFQPRRQVGGKRGPRRGSNWVNAWRK